MPVLMDDNCWDLHGSMVIYIYFNKKQVFDLVELNIHVYTSVKNEFGKMMFEFYMTKEMFNRVSN